nr:hypothetical protein [Mycolicibacter icosiumassiliensis]
MTGAAEVRNRQPRRIFLDRTEAGRVLAGLLDAYRDRDDVIVLGLARGGIPVAWQVAAAPSPPPASGADQLNGRHPAVRWMRCGWDGPSA